MMRWAIPVSILILGILWQPAEAQERNWEVTFTATTGDVVNEMSQTVQYQWPQDQPPNMTNQFKFEAEATISTSTTGEGIYSIGVTGTDPARVYLDGARVLDAWHSTTNRVSFIELAANTGYQMYLETEHGTSSETALMWKPPGETEWMPVLARDENTANWCDITLSWTAPTTREDSQELNPDTELDHFDIYRGACESGDRELRSEIPPEYRSVTKQQAIEPGSCYQYYITATDLDGLESAVSAEGTTRRECPQTGNAPPSTPVFVD